MKLKVFTEYAKAQYVRGSEGGYMIGFSIITSTGAEIKDHCPEWNESTLDKFQAKRLARLFKENAPKSFKDIYYYEVKNSDVKVFI